MHNEWAKEWRDLCLSEPLSPPTRSPEVNDIISILLGLAWLLFPSRAWALLRGWLSQGINIGQLCVASVCVCVSVCDWERKKREQRVVIVWWCDHLVVTGYRQSESQPEDEEDYEKGWSWMGWEGQGARWEGTGCTKKWLKLSQRECPQAPHIHVRACTQTHTHTLKLAI